MPPCVSAMLENKVDFPVACAVESSMFWPILMSVIMLSCSFVYGITNIFIAIDLVVVSLGLYDGVEVVLCSSDYHSGGVSRLLLKVHFYPLSAWCRRVGHFSVKIVRKRICVRWRYI